MIFRRYGEREGTYCAALARVGHVDLCAALLPDLGQVGALLADQGRDSLTRHLRSGTWDR